MSVQTWLVLEFCVNKARATAWVAYVLPFRYARSHLFGCEVINMLSSDNLTYPSGE